jgi:hypothetical protein
MPECKEVAEEFLINFKEGSTSGITTDAKWESSLLGEGSYEKVLNLPLEEYKFRYFLEAESFGLFDVNRIGGYMHVLKLFKYRVLDPELSILLDLDRF